LRLGFGPITGGGMGEGRGAGKRIPGIEEVRGVARDQQWHAWTVGGP
jgi:hypothetical protein